jgi:hypothetical protein
MAIRQRKPDDVSGCKFQLASSTGFSLSSVSQAKLKRGAEIAPRFLFRGRAVAKNNEFQGKLAS